MAWICVDGGCRAQYRRFRVDCRALVGKGTLALSVEAEGPDISAVEIGTAIVLSATRGTIVAEGAVVDSLERLVDPRTDVGGSELFLGMFRDCILVVA